LAEVPGRRVLHDTGVETARGIALVNLCFFLLTVGDVATVWALPMLGAAGAMLGRGMLGAASVATLALARPGGLFRLWPVRVRLVAIRSFIHALATLTWYVAWTWSLGLADSYAIGYAAPLLMILLARPMLGERVGWPRGLATAIGFLGMLVMVRPGGDLWRPAALLLAGGVCGMALSRNLTRLLAASETPECLAFWLMVAHLPVGAAMLVLGFPVPRLDATVVLCVLILGITNGIAHWLHSRACSLAPIAALAPYEYTGLAWAMPLGFIAFGQIPSATTIGGAAVVVAAGLYILYREQRRGRAERARAAIPLRAPGP
jgi:drug/metabolite transporter (DMT)-like permease